MAHVHHHPPTSPTRTHGAVRRTSVLSASYAEDAAKLLLRVVLGTLLLIHGVSKLQTGIGPIADMVQSAGLPRDLAYLAYVGEVLAPLMLILGAWTRGTAVIVVVHMVFAIGLAHSGDLLAMSDQGGYALELQAFYLFGALAIALLGSGRFGADGRDRWPAHPGALAK